MAQDIKNLLLPYKSSILQTYTKNNEITPLLLHKHNLSISHKDKDKGKSKSDATIWYIPENVEFPLRSYFPSLKSFFYLDASSKTEKLRIFPRIVLKSGPVPFTKHSNSFGYKEYSRIGQKSYRLQPCLPQPVDNHIAQSYASMYTCCVNQNSGIPTTNQFLDPLIINKVNLQGETEYIFIIPDHQDQSKDQAQAQNQNSKNSKELAKIIQIKPRGCTAKANIKPGTSQLENGLEIYSDELELFNNSMLQVDINCTLIASNDSLLKTSLFQEINTNSSANSNLPYTKKIKRENGPNSSSNSNFRLNSYHNSDSAPHIKLRLVGTAESIDILNPHSIQTETINPEFASIEFVLPPSLFNPPPPPPLPSEPRSGSLASDSQKSFNQLQILKHLYSCHQKNAEYYSPLFDSRKKSQLIDDNSWIKEYSEKIDAFIQRFVQEENGSERQLLQQHQQNEDNYGSDQSYDFLDSAWNLACEARDQNDIIDLMIAICDAFEQAGKSFNPAIRESNMSPLAKLIKERSAQIPKEEVAPTVTTAQRSSLEDATMLISSKIYAWIDNYPSIGIFYTGYSKISNELLAFFSSTIGEGGGRGIRLGFNRYVAGLIQECPDDPTSMMAMISKLHSIKEIVCYLLTEFGVNPQLENGHDYENENKFHRQSQVRIQKAGNSIFKGAETASSGHQDEMRELLKHLISVVVTSCLNYHFGTLSSNSNSGYKADGNVKGNRSESDKEENAAEDLGFGIEEYNISCSISPTSSSIYKLFKSLLEESCTIDWISVYPDLENIGSKSRPGSESRGDTDGYKSSSNTGELNKLSLSDQTLLFAKRQDLVICGSSLGTGLAISDSFAFASGQSPCTQEDLNLLELGLGIGDDNTLYMFSCKSLL